MNTTRGAAGPPPLLERAIKITGYLYNGGLSIDRAMMYLNLNPRATRIPRSPGSARSAKWELDPRRSSGIPPQFLDQPRSGLVPFSLSLVIEDVV